MNDAPPVSQFAELVLFALVAVLALAFSYAVWRGGGQSEPTALSVRWGGIAIVLTAVWLLVPALIAPTGVLREFARKPPPFLLFAGAMMLATAAVAYSPLGTRLINGVSVRWLVGFQVFRIPVELWLHRLHEEGVVPVQMTYAGLNFDIVSGTLAALLLIWSLAAQPPRWAVWIFNCVGLALLLNIITIAVLSAPTPLRQFFNEPANTFVAHMPFVWLPAFLVQAAWLGHLLVFRWLRRSAVQSPLKAESL